MNRILIVEDSLEEQELIRRALRSDYELEFAESSASGLDLASTQPPDLVLLDVGLPDGDGFDLCTRLKSNPRLEDVPVVFLTSRADTTDKVMAFKLGADDFLEKPFASAELRVRVEARLRTAQTRQDALSFSDMQLDPIRQDVILRGDDHEWSCELTPHEFRLLHCLAVRRGEPVPRAQLAESAWAGVAIAERTIDTHVSNLRRKLGSHGALLQAVRGVGYRLGEVDSRGV